jgi:SAM-dependent methyltransferase
MTERLRCPVCGSALHMDTEKSVCSGSPSHEFPLVDGIPILVNEAHSIFALSDFVQKRATYFSPNLALKKKLARFIPSISRNLCSSKNYARLVDLVRERDASPILLVIGGAVDGDGMEPLYASGLEVVCCDAALGPRTDFVCDGHDLPLADASVDACVVQAVLEHVADPQRCVAEIWRVLKPHALVYAETPFMQQVHGGVYDFTRFTFSGHRRLFKSFREVGAGIAGGPGMALAWAIRYFLLSLSAGTAYRMAITALVSLTCFWLPWLDAFLARQPGARDAASGFYFIGSKADQPITDRSLLTYGFQPES